MKIYVASSWRNEYQPSVVSALRDNGHEVYDFRHDGFGWSQVDPEWKNWTKEQYCWLMLEASRNAGSVIAKGFSRDMEALSACDLCVLVLPCGRSAHLEAGWAKGAGKGLIVLLFGELEPDLMYLMSDTPIALSISEVIGFINQDTMSSVRWP